MASVMRTSFNSSHSSLRAIFTHGAIASVALNPSNTVLLPCFNGAVLISPTSTRRLLLPAEDDVASAIALAPGAASAFVAGRSGLAVVTPLDSAVAPRTFTPFDNGVVAHAAFDASGGLLAVAQAGGGIRVYDVDKMHVTHAFVIKEDTLVTCLAFHTEKLLLYAGTEDGGVSCFNLESKARKALFVVRHHVSAVVGFAFLSGGKWVVGAGRDKIISVCQVRSGELVRLVSAGEELEGIVSMGKNLVVTAGDGGLLRVWDLEKGNEIVEKACRVPFVSSASSDRGEVDGDEGGMVENYVSGLQSCGEGKLVVSLTDHTVVTFAARSDGAMRAQSAMCGNLEQINDLQSLPEVTESQQPPDYLVASNSSLLWVLSPPSNAFEPIAQIDGEGGDGADEEAADLGEPGRDANERRNRWSCTDVLDGHRGIVLGVDVISGLVGEGKEAARAVPPAFAVSGSRDKTARVWHRAEGKAWHCVGIAEGHTDAVTAVALSPKSGAENFFIATAANDRTLKLWKLRHAITAGASTEGCAMRDGAWEGQDYLTRIVSSSAEEPETQLKASWTALAHEKDINAVAVSPDARLIATGSQDRTVKVWDAADGTLKVSCLGHRRGVFDVAFSPVDKVVASASGDATVRIWNAATGACLRSLQGHSGGVLRAVFMTRGMQIATSGMDGLLKMWSVRTGECDETIDGHSDAVWALDAARGGAAIASGGMDGVLEVWCDSTAFCAAAASARRDREASLTQRVDDAARARAWAVAASTALELNMPRKLKAVISELITSTEDADTALAEMVKGVAEPSIARLLRYCRDWGAAGGPGSAELSSRVVGAVFAIWPPAGFCETIGGGGRVLVEALVAHTARHESRVSEMSARVRFVDYTLEVMRALSDEKMSKPGMKETGSVHIKELSLKRKSDLFNTDAPKRRKRGRGQAAEY